ncbi:MAG: hypothetical protein KatS3mg035_1455 [Bacteroidia bacterium]|nr:MAG: hypothetical protein KatS3mg035_1455 [Bacteroidia bacterium]
MKTLLAKTWGLWYLCFLLAYPPMIYAQVFSSKPHHSFKINLSQLFTREIALSYEQGYPNRNASEFLLGYRLFAFYQKKTTFQFFYPVDYDKITPLIPYSSGFFGGYSWKHFSKTRKPKIDYFLALQIYARYQFYNDLEIYQKFKLQEQNYYANQSLQQYQMGIKFLTGKRYYHFNAFKESGWMYEIYGGIGFRLQYQNKTLFSKKQESEEQITVFTQPLFEKNFNIFPSVHLGISWGIIAGKMNTGN